VKLRFHNTGKSAAVFHVRSMLNCGPWTYTVSPDAHLFDTLSVSTHERSAYDLSAYGPNGFLRTFKGSVGNKGDANLAVQSAYELRFGPGITLDIHNRGEDATTVHIAESYTKQGLTHTLEPGQSLTWHWPFEASFGWYDLTITVDSDATFERRLAGHVETGNDSVSDPALGA